MDYTQKFDKTMSSTEDTQKQKVYMKVVNTVP